MPCDNGTAPATITVYTSQDDGRITISRTDLETEHRSLLGRLATVRRILGYSPLPCENDLKQMWALLKQDRASK